MIQDVGKWKSLNNSVDARFYISNEENHLAIGEIGEGNLVIAVSGLKLMGMGICMTG